MRGLVARWHDYMFRPEMPLNLGICRFLFCTLTAILFLDHDFSLWATLSNVWWHPIWLFRYFRLPVFSVGTIEALQYAWLASLLLGGLGLFTRLSTTAAFLLGTYLLGLEGNFGKLHQHTAIVSLILLVLALSPCGDAFSVDSVLRRRGLLRGRDVLDSPSGEYGWPIRCVQIFLSTGYFLAGLTKVLASGSAWVFSDNLRNILIEGYYAIQTSSPPITSLGLYLAQHVWACRLMAAMTIVVEICYPAALFSVPLRCVLVPAALAGHFFIMLAVGPRFWPFIIASVFWVNWSNFILRSSSIEEQHPG